MLPSVTHAILSALEQGATLDAAAVRSGVTPRSVHSWIARGRAVDADHARRDFAAAVDAARELGQARASSDSEARPESIRRRARKVVGAVFDQALEGVSPGARAELATALGPVLRERGIPALERDEESHAV